MTYPHSLTVERSIVATLLMRPDLIDTADIKPEHLWSPDNRAILALLQAMRRDGQEISAATVPEVVSRDPRPERYGGLEYVITLADDFVVPASLAGHIRQCRQDAARRQIMAIAEEAARRAGDSTEDPATLAAELRHRIDTIDMPGNERRWAHVSTACEDAAEQVRAVMANEIQPGLPTGCQRLDTLLQGGFAVGDLVILAARPSMGKTALGLQVAIHAAHLEHATGVCSLEMARIQLGQRLLSGDTKISSGNLRQGLVNGDQLSSVYNATIAYRDMPLWIDDSGGQSVSEVAAQARRLDRLARSKGYPDGLRLLVVDYLQLMDMAIGRGDTRAGAVGEASKALKALAKDLGCTVLALSQLSRQCEQRADKRPMMSDLRDSGAIEQDADTIIFLYREDKYNDKCSQHVRDVAEVIVAKQRQGPTGLVPMWWRDRETRFESMSDGSVDLWRRERK